MKTAPIGLFYGSSTCYTEMAAEKIQRQFAPDSVDVINIADTPMSEMQYYQQLILGIPTWVFGELQEDWEDHWDDIDIIDFSNKTVALYGLGDQIGYPEWFLDAMGYLHEKILLKGATIIGYWPNEGYEFTESQALTEDKQFFVGLALDDENEFDQTDERITTWCNALKTQFTLPSE
jgi:flavodoxin II